MHYIKELLESNNVVKAKAVLLFLLPYWYIAIYLFKKDFYLKEDIILIICMCLTISLITVFSLGLMLSYLKDKSRNKDKDDSFLEYFYEITGAVIILCVWLSLLIFISYSSCHLYNKCVNFYWFLILSLIPHFLIFLLCLLTACARKHLKKMSNNNQ